MDINEIMQKYTAGEITLVEANQMLEEENASFRLDITRNTITEAEKRATVVGYFPEQANGFGLLDTGTGSMEKVECKDGILQNVDCGDMYALYIIAGKIYRVEGTRLCCKDCDHGACQLNV